MARTTTVDIPVQPATAAALADARRRTAVGHLVDRLVQPGGGDPLLALLERPSVEARDAGLSEEVVDAELDDYSTERRA